MAFDHDSKTSGDEAEHTDAVKADDVAHVAGVVPEQNDLKLNFATWMAFFAICGQLNAYEMALLIPATTLSYINADLGPSPNYTWIAVSWTLGAAVVVSVSGRLSDIFGRRYFMLVGAFICWTGTVIGATGQSISQMIASGVILGIGSGVQETGFACFMEFIPNKYRLLFVGLYGTSAIFSIPSALISYAFIDHTSISWRGAYWYMSAWHIVAFIFLFVFYHPPTFNRKHLLDGKTKRQLIKELDYFGLLLFTAGCTLFLAGINFGGRQYHWDSPQVVACLVVGAVLLVVLGFWECFANLKVPLFPPHLFRNFRGFDVNIGVSFLCGMVYYSMQVIWPQESQLLFVPANDIIMRGVYANITLFSTWLSVLSVALICAHIHHERLQIIFFLSVQTLCVGLLSTVQVSEKGKAIALVFILSCTVNQPLYMLFSMTGLALKDQSDIGAAIGVLSTFRLIGGAIATATYTAILTNTFTRKLPENIIALAKEMSFPTAEIPKLIAAAASRNATLIKSVPGITAALAEATGYTVQVTYTQSYRVLYLAAIGFGVAGLACAVLTESTPRHKKDSKKAVILENERGMFKRKLDLKNGEGF